MPLSKSRHDHPSEGGDAVRFEGAREGCGLVFGPGETRVSLLKGESLKRDPVVADTDAADSEAFLALGALAEEALVDGQFEG